MAAYGAKFFPQAGAHFADVHYALAAAVTSSDTMQAPVAQMETRQADGKLAPGPCAIGLCRGVTAFAEGDYAGAVSILEPVVAELPRIGGSHAQRELSKTYDRGLPARGVWRQGEAVDFRSPHRRPSARDAAWSREAERHAHAPRA